MKITIFPLSPLRGEGVPDSIFLNFQLCSDIFFDSKTVNTETAHFKKFKLEGTVGRRVGDQFLLPSCVTVSTLINVF